MKSYWYSKNTSSFVFVLVYVPSTLTMFTSWLIDIPECNVYKQTRTDFNVYRQTRTDLKCESPNTSSENLSGCLPFIVVILF